MVTDLIQSLLNDPIHWSKILLRTVFVFVVFMYNKFFFPHNLPAFSLFYFVFFFWKLSICFVFLFFADLIWLLQSGLFSADDKTIWYFNINITSVLLQISLLSGLKINTFVSFKVIDLAIHRYISLGDICIGNILLIIYKQACTSVWLLFST